MEEWKNNKVSMHRCIALLVDSMKHWWVYETVGSSGRCQRKECHSPQFPRTWKGAWSVTKYDSFGQTFAEFVHLNQIELLFYLDENWKKLFGWEAMHLTKNTIEILHPPDIFRSFTANTLWTVTPRPSKKKPGSRSPASPDINPTELIIDFHGFCYGIDMYPKGKSHPPKRWVTIS